ncbi:MAG: 3-oxoacyl-[acyl-carrier-protein] reductase [Brooklawnia sp.]
MSQTNTATGRVAVITGASRGIGAAIAETLRDSGYRVASLDISADAPDQVLGVVCDVTDAASVDEAFGRVEADLGPVEVLVANAGITRDTLLMRMSDQDWQQVIDVNLTGAYRVVRRATRGMVRQRFGRIVATSSVVGLLGSAGQVNYAASKSGLIGMARSVAREVGSRGITFNIVSPGFIQTAMTDVLDEATQKSYAERIPAGRMGTIADVANAVKFLVSDEAGYITGAVIPVDGGLGMGH